MSGPDRWLPYYQTPRCDVSPQLDIRKVDPMSSNQYADAQIPHVDEGGDITGLPREGLLGGELCDAEMAGVTLLEYVLPNRFVDGPNVPFKASYWSVVPGCYSPLERHAVHEIWFVAGGEGELMFNSRKLRVRPGQAIYVVPNTAHQVRSCGSDDLRVFSVWWP